MTYEDAIQIVDREKLDAFSYPIINKALIRMKQVINYNLFGVSRDPSPTPFHIRPDPHKGLPETRLSLTLSGISSRLVPYFAFNKKGKSDNAKDQRGSGGVGG